ncbi:MAG: hypothetical protein GX616_10340 [Planctomycetes bacterium]|nr:hypothetical protein [Planctomycetota bacterium]
MSDELSNLEREVEKAMASLPSLLAEPSDAAVLRVKAAVRYELNEEWLAGQAAPLPSAEAVRRVHEAVVAELAKPAAAHLSAWGRMAAALAAAAMIAVSVGVIRQAGLVGSSALSPEVVAAENHVELFLAAAEEVLATDTLTESIYDDLSVIEEDINGWQSMGSGETGGLGDILREIDSTATESPGGDGVSGISRASQGVWG